jgi:hypothetical protein
MEISIQPAGETEGEMLPLIRWREGLARHWGVRCLSLAFDLLFGIFGISTGQAI